MIPAIEILLKGIILGLTVSMPLGPIGIVLINRTIKRGILSGLFSGLGLAAADTLLAILSGIGYTVIMSLYKRRKIYNIYYCRINYYRCRFESAFIQSCKRLKEQGKS